MPDDLQKTLRNEFYLRYLDSIGAQPTPANLALVRKHVGMGDVTAAWKSRGWSSDELHIAPVLPEAPAAARAVAAARRPRRRRGGAAADNAAEVARLLHEYNSAAADGGGAAEESGPVLRDSAPTGAMPFEEAQKQFLYPHKLGAAQRERARPLPASAGWTGVGVGRFGSRDLQRYPPVPEEDVLAELRAELRLHTKEIVALQADFVRLFPFDKLTRLKADELKIALAELSSKSMARFVGLLALLLYWVHIAPKAKDAAEAGGDEPDMASDDQLGALFCATQEHWAQLRARMMTRARSCRRCCRCCCYRRASASRRSSVKRSPSGGRRSTRATRCRRSTPRSRPCSTPTSTIRTSRSLESSTEAIRIAARDELGVKYRAREARFYSTSTMVRAALPRAPLVNAHRRVGGAGLPPAAATIAARRDEGAAPADVAAARRG